jgi:hypothetical protein
MNVIITGKIIDIFPLETYGKFTKRVIWVEEQEVQYPNTYSIEFTGRNVPLVDSLVLGNMVKCQVDLRGRAYEKDGKKGCINSLSCWRVDRQGQSTRQAPSTRQQTGGIPPQGEQSAPGWQAASDDDDLPF